MSSSSKELEEPLRHRVIQRAKKFEERRLFDIEIPHEFQEKYHLSVEAFESLLAAVHMSQQLEQINLIQL